MWSNCKLHTFCRLCRCSLKLTPSHLTPQPRFLHRESVANSHSNIPDTSHDFTEIPSQKRGTYRSHTLKGWNWLYNFPASYVFWLSPYPVIYQVWGQPNIFWQIFPTTHNASSMEEWCMQPRQGTFWGNLSANSMEGYGWTLVVDSSKFVSWVESHTLVYNWLCGESHTANIGSKTNNT